MEDEDGQSLFEKFSSIEEGTTLNKDERRLKKHFDLLDNNNLIGEPYFQVKLPNSKFEYQTVCIKAEEFKKVSEYEWGELQKNMSSSEKIESLRDHKKGLNAADVSKCLNRMSKIYKIDMLRVCKRYK